MGHLQECFSKAMSFFNSGHPICLDYVIKCLMAPHGPQTKPAGGDGCGSAASGCLSDKTTQAMGIIPKASLLYLTYLRDILACYHSCPLSRYTSDQTLMKCSSDAPDDSL